MTCNWVIQHDNSEPRITVLRAPIATSWCSVTRHLRNHFVLEDVYANKNADGVLNSNRSRRGAVGIDAEKDAIYAHVRYCFKLLSDAIIYCQTIQGRDWSVWEYPRTLESCTVIPQYTLHTFLKIFLNNSKSVPERNCLNTGEVLFWEFNQKTFFLSILAQ